MKKIKFYEHNLILKNIDFQKPFKSNYLTSGPISSKVEKIISERFNSNCILTNSWTNGVIALFLALNLKKSDEVIIPACTYVACANVVKLVGCKIVFCDIDKNTKLMSIDDCLKKVTKNTKLIMPVHLYGNVFDTKELRSKLKKSKIYILEDCAHIFHGKYHSKVITHYADFAAFSFYATKNLTAGEGGCIVSKNSEIINKIRSIANNGMSKSAFNRFNNNRYNHWDVEQYGLKANMSDINSNILLDQLRRYKINYNIRKKIYDIYKRKLQKFENIEIPLSNSEYRDYHLFPIGLKTGDRDKLIQYLNKYKIPVTVNYRSIQELKYYSSKKKCKESFNWGRQTLSLPFHNNLKLDQINFIIKKIKNFLDNEI